MKKMRNRFWWICICFAVFTLALNALAHHFPYWTEQWYSRGLFQGIRWVVDHTIALSPLANFYLFWAGVAIFWVSVFLKRPKKSTWKTTATYWSLRITGFAALLFALFFWLWGFNYARVPLQTQLGLKEEPVDTLYLWRELERETNILDSLRNRIVGRDSAAMQGRSHWPQNAEGVVRACVTAWLSENGFPTTGAVRGRLIYPEGLLLKFGAAGIYWPFAGEGNVEGGLHELRQLPAMAHEMSHGYGFTDEGVCNFIEYVACSRAPDPYLAYCARLDYWSILANACAATDEKRYEERFRPFIPKGIAADIRAIREKHSKFRELAPRLRYKVYDSYLKSQGISAGMLNYDEVLLLVQAWRKKQG